jgi:signal transduction histidine kinase
MATPATIPVQSNTTFIANPRESALQGGLEDQNPHQLEAVKSLALDLSTRIKNLFGAAANTAGYAMNLDGLIFFDAIPPGDCNTGNEFSQRGVHENDPTTTPLSEYAKDGSTVRRVMQQPRQSVIRRLVAEFPQGHLFVIDEHGILDCRSDRNADSAQRSRDDLAALEGWDGLLTCIPDARYAIFLPLWHYQREVCFATCLAWVNDTAKTLDSSDLNSLTAFGNSLMSEIFRLEAATNTQAKSDFISSISHELRSPLHGILATVELIQESIKDPDLLSMADMIESCSNTLLDTFNHLLEFSSINSRAKDVSFAEKTTQKHSDSADSHTRKAAVDMRALVEDVVETGSLGHFSDVEMNHGLMKKQRKASVDREKAFSSNPVIITTNIENKHDWVIATEKGAWKRILLNIFSNALKFTRSGHVEVALKTLEKTNSDPQYISLSVTDTGIGMSHEFLKYHLFAPFMQENNLSSGTGLGLSIVKSIVESLRGKIYVESRLHEGTCVTVNVPLEQEWDPPNLVQHDRLQGLSLGLLSIAPSGLPGTESIPRIVPPHKALLRSIRNICQGQLGMVVTTVSTNLTPNTEVLAIDTHGLTLADKLAFEVNSFELASQTTAPVIILLGVPVQGIAKMFGTEEAVCVTSPITGRKIQAGLLSALCKATQESNLSISPSVSVGGVVPPQVDQVYTQGLLLKDTSSVPGKKYATVSLDSLPAQDALDVTAKASGILKSPKMSFYQTESTLQTTTDPAAVCHFKRLLLVDDNPINLKVLVAFANRLGLPFSTAADGAEAVHLYRNAALEEADPFDCIFMDISMPIMDGFQAVTAIREFEIQQGKTDIHEPSRDRTKSRLTSRSYVLALTGLGSEAARRSARASGFDEFLLKPVKFKDVAPLLGVKPP